MAIYDFETDFSNHLMEYMNRRKGFDFCARVFTNMESLNACLRQNRIDILLLGEDVAELLGDRLCGRENIGQICLLSENSRVKENSPFPVIFKFQSAEELIREIMLLYASDMLEGERIPAGNMKLYSVYSPCGGSGKTCIALSAALELSGRGETLYVGLEPYSVLSVLMKQKPERGISDWIYYLKQSGTALRSKFGSVVCRKDSLDYIAQPENGMDLNELTAEDMEKWIEQLGEENYRYVVFDIGVMNSGIMTLLRSSSRILVPVGSGYLEQEKYSCFLGQLERAGEKAVAGRLKRICPPRDELLSGKEFGLWQLQEGRLGGYIREILREE